MLNQMMADDRGVNHFDRKFVASNLKKLLHCPKCTRDYTYSKEEQNHRPFLLPCGHNLCESCVWKNRQNLMCAVCQKPAPPLINAKDPSSKQSGARVCDFYELNYHVLGEASSFINFHSLKTEPVNETLSPNLFREVIIQATKCSECDQVDATGECSQCNAFYCLHCFEAVHKHSRVLKSHIYQKMAGERSNLTHKGFCVGNDVFKMPYQKDCHHHRLPENIYCSQCRRTICKKCSDLYHNSHRKRPLTEINLRLASEIPSTLHSLNSALMNIHNGQEVVRAAKQKLSDYASKTLASITKHFCHLHGLLQVAELQVIESLRESSLPPQMTLNEAMGKLSGYEEMIKRLMQYLEIGSKTKMGVPNNVWLKEIISLVNEHMEKIPSIVEVSKITENPYRLYKDMPNIDIPNIIDNMFKCEFVDPNIKVGFQNDFERYCSFSLSSSSGKENSCRSNIMGTPQQYPLSQRSNFHSMSNTQERGGKKSNKSHLNLSAAATDRFQARTHQQQQDFVRSFSALDIRKPNVTSFAVVNRTIEKGDWFKTDSLVKVRSIISPEDFYVQGVHAFQRVREELDNITQSLTGSTPPEIVVGQHYITFHQDQKRFYRSMVSQKLAAQDTYKVFLPDVGLYAEMHNSHFREMPERLAHLPYSAVHCSLRQLRSSCDDPEWDTKATAFLKQIVQNNSVHVIVYRALAHDLHEVDLIASNYNTDISVREAFLYSGMARTSCDRAPFNGLELLQKKASPNLRLPRNKVQFGDIFMIQMLHVEHPQEFYVMRHEFEAKRCLLQSNLQRYMNQVSVSKLENIFLGRLHLGCVLQSDGQWKRASITQILPDGYVEVQLVDDGPSQKVYWDHLFVLPSMFWDPGLAIKCCLADVETMTEWSYLWTPEATAAFKQLTSNPKLHAEVIKTTKNAVFVALRFTRAAGSETTNIAVQMVAQGHCMASGESSRTFNKAPTISQRSSRHHDVDIRRFLDQQKGRQSVELRAIRQAEEDSNIKRVKVKILYVRQPDEFYVTLYVFQSVIENLQKSVQVSAERMYRDQDQHISIYWQFGDHCYVRVQAQFDLEPLWHRGVVTKVNSSSALYHVQLRDFGQVAEDVPASCMVNMDSDNMRISSSAKRCHLHGIKALGSDWSNDEIEFFKHQLQAYDQVYVTGQGYTNNSLSVILWGSQTVISGPFSPARTKFVNINKIMLEGMKNSQQAMPDNVSFCSMGSINSRDTNAMQFWLDKIDKSKQSIHNAIEAQPGFEHNEDMPPMELLDDLGKNQTTIGQNVPPAGWTTPRKCDKSIFTGIATNVNYECSVYLTFRNDKPYLEHIRKLLEIHYKSLMEKQQEQGQAYTYEVGQAVVVTYHMDNLLYRGIVQHVRRNHDMYTVYYVDYGNLEQVRPDEMLPYAPFPQLSAMCWLVNIHGVRPKAGKYTTQQMDTVHRHLVMKLSSVRVVDPKANPPTCSMKVGNIDLAAMMVDCGIAISTETSGQISNSQDFQDFAAFKVFDEFESLANVPQSLPHRCNETYSSVQQPPAKKMYLVNPKEVMRFENDQDINCQDAAKDIYPNSSPICSDMEGYENCEPQEKVNYRRGCIEEAEAELDSDISGHDMDIDMMDIGMMEEESEEYSYSSSDVGQMKPLRNLAANQLQRRIDLRRKAVKDNVCFSPMDTSSERSIFNGSNSFKRLYLPNGVEQFQCTVDNVLSATELQIAPCLSEFTKHEISLVQETSFLINEATALSNPKLNDLCLARYTKDKQWYRAIIKEIQESTEQAIVFYIDFHDTERVAYSHLKEMPSQLFMIPLRSFRVKLHGIKKSGIFEDKIVRQCLKACLCNYPLVYARVHYPLNYHANSSTHSKDVSQFDLIEIELFENKHKKKLAYQSLIDNWMLILESKH